MAQILSLIFKDKDLCNVLGFKGGTALMFFHNLPRFSTDLDFNLLDAERQDAVYEKVRRILLRFGTIDDEAKKMHGQVGCRIRCVVCTTCEGDQPQAADAGTGRGYR